MIVVFDRNLPFRLPRALVDVYPGALYVRHPGSTQADDKEIWLYAAADNCVIVSPTSETKQISLTKDCIHSGY